MKIRTFSKMNESEQNDLNDIVDALRVAAELSGFNVEFSQSWVDCMLEYSDDYFGYKLIFEMKISERSNFSSVRLLEFIKGIFGYRLVFSSNSYRYKSGKLSRPISSFIKKIEEAQNVEIF
ncbi:MAG: hypothetical protein K0R18_527 [Bacillales bacterium]|jgi:hypothetical protein|nr:hypothetical protein [Bacillales bacterium]